ncbi:3-hydroxybutyryl-CoA dehydrogenase [Aeromicrobium wangtongii]|uniref:3-hydroxybutyryl-CoA dehydrogenase n=1 Tax=Aeromicrobium wangtongii TaxID=2969247 RepID=A0ABY5M8H8_9ACTN|nr:3-hydroxybutyryl-CoA dehydrogenase [Aeromicrobium wangtongii]MCD9200164.1 3-hydroxybutyryl-CoA dehydrogenase [Aeromicrobium wangtongii]MCL3820361.1 3-hydroxybutyryl-CoA dehydrogenase [Aeromicrobium wangtongii]UUP13419.1 3-hydroxybutyryl-CoA dehydrogenase [Aeromicrobium wangtongii]
MSGIEKVGVIGGGLMGSGITEVAARAGLDVIVIEISDDAAKAAAERVEGSLRKAESRGKIESAEVTAVLERIRFETDLETLADRDLVVEAASEHEETKLELFRNLGRILTKDDAILASNTSSIPIVKLGAVSGRAHHVMGVHFFNPAPVMQLVELIPSLTTSSETLDRMRSWVTTDLGKKPIDATDRAGFVVNSLLVPYLLSAIRMYEAGYASAEDIDRGMVLGCGHPMGPLALSDLIGLDTIKAIGKSMYDEFKEPLYSPPPLLDRMVDAGLLGKKSGQGFYGYEGR